MVASLMVVAGWAIDQPWIRGGGDAGPLRAEISRVWHGEIVTSALQANIAPAVQLSGRPVLIDDLPQGDLLPALSSLYGAMAIYPAGFLDRIVKRVVLAGRIRMWNLDVGGFFNGSTVAINDASVASPDGKVFSADTFHHELSSIIRNQVLFNVSEWTADNPPGFRYLSLDAYKALLAKPPSVEGDAALHDQGFVAAYGTTSLDNDWNTYAEKVFGHGPQFAELIRRYPKMRSKTRQLLDIYAGLDQRFEAYFRQSGLRRTVSDGQSAP